MSINMCPPTPVTLPKIGLVEDDHEMRALLTEFLTLKGFEVGSYADPRHFWERFSQGLHPEIGLLVSDITLPGMTGIHLLERMKTAAPHVPVVLMSANLTDPEEVSAWNLGADALLRKPFPLDYFHQTIDQAHRQTLAKRAR